MSFWCYRLEKFVKLTTTQTTTTTTTTRSLQRRRWYRLYCPRSFCSLQLHPLGYFHRHKSLQSLFSLRRRTLTTRIANDDKYEHYRHLSDDVLRLFQKENDRTRRCIDQRLKEEIANEILVAYEEAASLQNAIPDLGPTGKYLYHVEEDNGRRLYFRRQHVVNESTSLKEQQKRKHQQQQQLVLDISFHEYQLHGISLSVDEGFLAYLISSVTSPTKTMVRIRHLDSGRVLTLPTTTTTVTNGNGTEQLLRIVNVEWGPLQLDGSHSLFVVSSNDVGRPCAVHACCVTPDGEVSSPLQCIYDSAHDEAVMVDVQRTKGCQYVAIHSSTKRSNQIWLVRYVHDEPILIRPSQDGVLYHVDVGKHDNVFLLAHAVEPQYKISGLEEEMTLFETTVSSLPLRMSSFGMEHMRSLDDDEYIIADMDVFSNFVALYERSSVDGRHRIRVRLLHSNAKDEEDVIIPIPPGSGDCAVLSSAGNMYYESTCVRFRVESPCRCPRTYSFDTRTRQLQLLGNEPVYDESSYVEKRVLVTSDDGTSVPMTIIYSNIDTTTTGHEQRLRPAVLIGYGAYGEPVCHGFDPTIIPLLNRGFVVAFAHTRGGGELGRAWYRAGQVTQKERVIDDFVACARALVDDPLGMTEPRLLSAKAFSAGGVTVAGAMNRHGASLFGNVVLTNAFLDVATSMANPNLALTEHEWDEWGNVLCDDNAARVVSSYCPMSNVSYQDYPRILVIGTLDDANVPYWHSLTFFLKLRDTLKGHERKNRSDASEEGCVNPQTLLWIESCGGHQLHGSKLDVAATEAAFIIGATELSPSAE